MIEKRKILIAVDSLYAGGAGKVASLLSNYLNNKNCVTIATIYDARVRYKIDDGIEYISLVYKKPINRLKAILALLKKKFDIVISLSVDTNIYFLISKFFKRFKLIISERSDPYFSPSSKKVRMLRKILYRFSNGCVFQTKYAADYFGKSCSKKGTIIQNPILNDVFDINNDFSNKRIVSTGRLTKVKNYKMAIDAFNIFSKNNSGFTYEIYGEGELKEELNNYILEKKLGDKVLLRGFSDNVLNEIKNSYIFLLTSFHEGMPNSLIEAMAIGIPSICTNFPVSRELIKDGENGEVVEINDAIKLAKKMNHIVNDTSLLYYYSNNSKQFARKFSSDSIFKKWDDYISRVMNGE